MVPIFVSECFFKDEAKEPLGTSTKGPVSRKPLVHLLSKKA